MPETSINVRGPALLLGDNHNQIQLHCIDHLCDGDDIQSGVPLCIQTQDELVELLTEQFSDNQDVVRMFVDYLLELYRFLRVLVECEGEGMDVGYVSAHWQLVRRHWDALVRALPQPVAVATQLGRLLGRLGPALDAVLRSDQAVRRGDLAALYEQVREHPAIMHTMGVDGSFLSARNATEEFYARTTWQRLDEFRERVLEMDTSHPEEIAPIQTGYLDIVLDEQEGSISRAGYDPRIELADLPYQLVRVLVRYRGESCGSWLMDWLETDNNGAEGDDLDDLVHQLNDGDGTRPGIVEALGLTIVPAGTDGLRLVDADDIDRSSEDQAPSAQRETGSNPSTANLPSATQESE